MQTTSTIITLAGKERQLTFDRHTRFRYGQLGGNLNALLLVAGQDYFQSVILIWAALDAETRGLYPQPENLVDYIAENDERILAPALQAIVEAGWLKTGESAQKSASS